MSTNCAPLVADLFYCVMRETSCCSFQMLTNLILSKLPQLIRLVQVSSHVDDFNTRNKVMTQKLLRHGYRYHKIRKAFSKIYRRHFDKVSKYNVGLKNFFCKAFQNPNFIRTWCTNSER